MDEEELQDMIDNLEELLDLQQFYTYDKNYEFHKTQVEKLLEILKEEKRRCDG